MTGEPQAHRGAWRRAAGAVVWLRWVIVLFWILVAAGATSLAPDAPSSGGGIAGLLPENSAPIQAEARSFDEFELPVLSRLVVVQHNPKGLSANTRRAIVREAVTLDTRLLRQGIDAAPRGDVLAALPLVNSTRAIPSSTGDGTTAVTYLFGSPFANLSDQTRSAQAYADRLGGPAADVVGLTGLIPAQNEQGRLISDRLPLIEVATAAFVLLVVGIAFRSVIAPLVTVATALLSYLVAIRLLGLVGQVIDIAVPRELEPLILALLIGVVADYSVFYLFAARRRLRAGQPRLDAARGATADYSRVILAAGLRPPLMASALQWRPVRVW